MDSMHTMIEPVLLVMMHHRMVQLVVFAVCADTIFGFIRALKEHTFNSCFGIDGAIRKISMILSLTLLVGVDLMIDINLLAFVPKEALAFFGLERVGTAEFFGLLYICYEAVSILKNMYLCGLPVYGIWKHVRDFLGKYTDELPDSDEMEQTMEAHHDNK